MGKLVISEFMTLDGVIESPNLWSSKFWSPELAEFKRAELFSADCLLLGRITYTSFAQARPSSDPSEATSDYAQRINTLPKFVVARSAVDSAWNNTHIISGSVVEEVARLKAETRGDILVFGSVSLSQTLITNHLVDLYRLLVYPIILGQGKKLFTPEMSSNLELVDSRKFDSGVVSLEYTSLKTGPQ